MRLRSQSSLWTKSPRALSRLLMAFAMASALFVLGVSVSPARANEHNVFRFCTLVEAYPPFIMKAGHNVPEINPGITFEFIQSLEQRLPIKVHFVRRPWKRCLRMLQYGQVDGLISPYSRRDEILNGHYPSIDGKLDPTRHYSETRYAVFVRKGSAITWDGATFTNLKGGVAAPRGFSVSYKLKALDVHVNEALTPKQALYYLAEGKLSAAIVSQKAGQEILREEKIEDQVVILSPDFSVRYLYLVLSDQFYKANPELSGKIWDEVQSLREDIYPQLESRYKKLSPR